VHCVDLVEWLAGPIAAVESARLTDVHHGVACLQLASGASVAIEAGWQAPALSIDATVTGQHHRAQLRGGRLDVDGALRMDASPPSAGDAIGIWLDHLAGRDAPPLVEPRSAVRAADLIDELRRATTGAH
jgi:hypothetical protein